MDSGPNSPLIKMSICLEKCGEPGVGHLMVKLYNSICVSENLF